MAMISGMTSSLYQSQFVNQFQQMRASFQQLGADLGSGNVAAAQKDFASLTQTKSSATTSTTSGSQTSFQQEMQQLGQDLQSGNLSAAQQDYASIQRSAQQSGFAHTEHAHHHNHGAGASSTTEANTTGSDPMNLLKSVVASAASAYGSGGLTGALAAGSMISQIA